MTLPPIHPQRRATRLKFEEAVPSIVFTAHGKRAQGKLQTISVTGGLMRLAEAIRQGDFVEIAFQTQSGPVRSLAEMLPPMRRASDGTLQPFRIVALADESHRTLSTMVDAASDSSSLRVLRSPFRRKDL